MSEKVTGNSHPPQCCKLDSCPALSVATGEEASLWVSIGKGCLGSRLTAGIWRASKKGSYLLQFARSGSMGQERGLEFKERVLGVNGVGDRGFLGIWAKYQEKEKDRESERKYMCNVLESGQHMWKRILSASIEKKNGRKRKSRVRGVGDLEGGAQVD